MMITRRLVSAVGAAVFAITAFGAGAAQAGPPADVFNGNDQAWFCSGDTDDVGNPAPVPPNHCLNANSRGNTGVIIVLEPDPRGPAEGISFDPKANDRPCPHDDQEGDGTWWTPNPESTDEGPWVCHHKPPTP
ncbi:MAG: hypothetical protein ACO3VI_09610 [Ilumatobacteraceae bacterium]